MMAYDSADGYLYAVDCCHLIVIDPSTNALVALSGNAPSGPNTGFATDIAWDENNDSVYVAHMLPPWGNISVFSGATHRYVGDIAISNLPSETDWYTIAVDSHSGLLYAAATTYQKG